MIFIIFLLQATIPITARAAILLAWPILLQAQPPHIRLQ